MCEREREFNRSLNRAIDDISPNHLFSHWINARTHAVSIAGDWPIIKSFFTLLRETVRHKIALGEKKENGENTIFSFLACERVVSSEENIIIEPWSKEKRNG